MPLLEVLTRTYRRPTLLAANQASLMSLASTDWTQTLFVDEVGRGVPWANRQFATYGQNLIGNLIWVLDDDDECIRPTLVDELRKIARIDDPDVILMRMDHGPRGILPDAEQWGLRELEIGHIGCSAFVVRRAVWQRHAVAWGERYAGDFDFIKAVLDDPTVRVYWHDVIASRVQKIGYGMPEGGIVQVKALKALNVLIDGQLLRIQPGMLYNLPIGAVEDLLRAGYVTPVAQIKETAMIVPSATPEAGLPVAKRKKAAP